MTSRSKTVELGGKKFEVRKLPPEVGSFIFMRMLGVSMRSAAIEKEYTSEEPDKTQEPETKTTGEMRVRALSFSVFSGGMSFEDFKFVQSACMKVTSSVVNEAGQDFPMPVMTDSGIWTKPHGQELANDVGLVMNLTTECLVFAFSDFFGGSSLGLQT